MGSSEKVKKERTKVSKLQNESVYRRVLEKLEVGPAFHAESFYEEITPSTKGFDALRDPGQEHLSAQQQIHSLKSERTQGEHPRNLNDRRPDLE